MTHKNIKEEIRNSYAKIANDHTSESCCVDTACCPTKDLAHTMTESYVQIKGYQKEADLALGCGIPTQVANIREGDTVIDLGSGAGNDVFIARQMVGKTGRVIGIDSTPEMVIRALKNNLKLGFNNVEFYLNEIENMENIADDSIDVAISNCVMNLVSDKKQAFSEVFRVLKFGGHFSISDIVFTRKVTIIDIGRGRNACRLCCRGKRKRQVSGDHQIGWFQQYTGEKRKVDRVAQ